MHARVTFMHYPPEQHEQVERILKDEIVPHHEQPAVQGLKGAHCLLDKAKGKGIGIAVYETRGHVRESEPHIDPKRDEAVLKAGGTVDSVEVFEVVGHLWKG